MTTGMEFVVRLPLPGTHSRRLLDVIKRIPGTDTPEGQAAGNNMRWLNGVKFEPWPCRKLQAIASADCSEETLAAITAVCEPAITQKTFQIIDALKASTLEWTVEMLDAYLGLRAQTMMSSVFASELISGTASTGYSLSGSAHAPDDIAFGAAAKPVWEVLAALESELADSIPNQQGLIHMPPGLMSTAVTSYGLSPNANGVFETVNGNLVVSDSGYYQPKQPTGQPAPSAGTDWIYASGPVFYQATDFMGLGIGSETYNFSRNTINRWISGYGILVFDPCPVTAALATYSTL